MSFYPWAENDFHLVFGKSKIDFDASKDDYNRKEHKYGLESAVALLTRILSPGGPIPPYAYRDASTVEERRHEFMTIDDSNKVIFFVTTMRADETVRVISMRRANKVERDVFYKDTGFLEQPN
jgi:uncharacterized DUF497 family protein